MARILEPIHDANHRLGRDTEDENPADDKAAVCLQNGDVEKAGPTQVSRDAVENPEDARRPDEVVLEGWRVALAKFVAAKLAREVIREDRLFTHSSRVRRAGHSRIRLPSAKHTMAASLFLLSLLATPAASPLPVPTNTIQLFNGTNLAGWSSWLVDTKRDDPRHVFTVTNGMIHLSGDGLGYLATTSEFGDYRLTVEFKWGEQNTHWGDRTGKARDSGVFLHATGPDGNSDDGGGAFMAAIECNLFQGATGDFLLIRGHEADGQLIAPRVTVSAARKRDADGWPRWQPDGQLVTLERWGRVNWSGKSASWTDELDFRGPRDVEKPYGEWNRLEIMCEGAHLEAWLNGMKVNEVFAVWPHFGKILLQCEGSEIFFRRVSLRSPPATR